MARRPSCSPPARKMSCCRAATRPMRSRQPCASRSRPSAARVADACLAVRRRRNPVWQPSEEQMGHWPATSGNAINGVGEAARRRPSPIYWHDPDSTPHGPLQRWFYQRSNSGSPELVAARAERQRVIDAPLAPLAAVAEQRVDWSDDLKRIAREAGADDVGITTMRADYVFEGRDVPTQRWIIVLAVAQDYDVMRTAPSVPALVEVTRQYARGTRVAKAVASWLRERGHDAFPY